MYDVRNISAPVVSADAASGLSQNKALLGCIRARFGKERVDNAPSAFVAVGPADDVSDRVKSSASIATAPAAPVATLILPAIAG